MAKRTTPKFPHGFVYFFKFSTLIDLRFLFSSSKMVLIFMNRSNHVKEVDLVNLVKFLLQITNAAIQVF